ncbi:unnamed protein product [Adineta steineri]|uniref:Uncharacterized protein n=1 Tax=Adineta steineri TaxID=433720 RepID=A0A815M058_9BILA|nr:unnamed protein product [Adineta steineri]CAF3545418.1 unnamed protein product [Adineta steineri]
MNSINIGWNKQVPDRVQFTSSTKYIEQDLIQETKNKEKHSRKKFVRFNDEISSNKQQVFENTAYDVSETVHSQKSIFKNHDFPTLSTNIFATKLPEINDKQLCSVRAIFITLIIVVSIIIVTAIAIGIVFGITGSRQKDNNNDQNSLSTVSTTVLLSSVSIGSQIGQPCLSYTTINDPTRNIAQNLNYGTCDNGPLFNASNGGSWIRFVGTGGTIIPLTSAGDYHCGAFLSGWFNGTLPTAVGTSKNGTVCFDIYMNSCIVYANVIVVNCNGYFVYFLPPVPLCLARYCTT